MLRVSPLSAQCPKTLRLLLTPQVYTDPPSLSLLPAQHQTNVLVAGRAPSAKRKLDAPSSHACTTTTTTFKMQKHRLDASTTATTHVFNKAIRSNPINKLSSRPPSKPTNKTSSSSTRTKPSRPRPLGTHNSNRPDICSSPVRGSPKVHAIYDAVQSSSGGRRVGDYNKGTARCAIYPSFKPGPDAIPHPLVEEFRKAREQMINDRMLLQCPDFGPSLPLKDIDSIESMPSLSPISPVPLMLSSLDSEFAPLFESNSFSKEAIEGIVLNIAEYHFGCKGVDTNAEPTPFVRVAVLNQNTNIVSVASGLEHGLALSQDGRVWSLGGLHAHGIIEHLDQSIDPAFLTADTITKEAARLWRSKQGVTAQLIRGLDMQPIKQIACTDHASFLLTRDTGVVFMFGRLKKEEGCQSQWFYADSPSNQYVLVRLPTSVMGESVQSISAAGNQIWTVTSIGQVHTFGFSSAELLWHAPSTGRRGKGKGKGSGTKHRNGIPYATHTITKMTTAAMTSPKPAAKAGQPKRRKAYITSVTLGRNWAAMIDMDGDVWVMGSNSAHPINTDPSLSPEPSLHQNILYKPTLLNYSAKTTMSSNKAMQVQVGGGHIVILNHGSVYSGIGLGVNTEKTAPDSGPSLGNVVIVDGLVDIMEMSLWDDVVYALDKNGVVWRWTLDKEASLCSFISERVLSLLDSGVADNRVNSSVHSPSEVVCVASHHLIKAGGLS
ncbi:hypothetical protein BSLG_007393 [Batrachochytrium salamandrivorans]|nr:hypothetical protein BSLG_007393 [Batrachochytrium salamandrivorans]